MLPVAVARSISGGVVMGYLPPVLWMTLFSHKPRGGMTLTQQPRCSVMALIASCPRRRRALRLDETFVQGLPGRSLQSTIELFKQAYNIPIEFP